MAAGEELERSYYTWSFAHNFIPTLERHGIVMPVVGPGPSVRAVSRALAPIEADHAVPELALAGTTQGSRYRKHANFGC